jgi:peroxiredoxin
MFKTILKSAMALLTILLVATFSAPLVLAQNRTAEFSFHSIDGDTVTAEGLRGQVIVLAFGAAWLPLSKNQLEGVKKLADDYAEHGVAVYWVSTDSDSAKSKNYASEDQLRALARKYKVAVLRDPEGVVSKKLGVDQLPTVVIIDKQGNISGAPLAGLDPNANLTAQLSDRLKKIL